MIPLLNITPVHEPTATNSNAMGSLADMLAEIGLRHQKMKQEREIADQNADIQRQEMVGKNEYYGSIADTRKAEAANRADERKNKADLVQSRRMEVLQDAYRKAQSPGERQMILDQIKAHAASTGQSLTEIMEDVPDTATNVAPKGGLVLPDQDMTAPPKGKGLVLGDQDMTAPEPMPGVETGGPGAGGLSPFARPGVFAPPVVSGADESVEPSAASPSAPIPLDRADAAAPQPEPPPPPKKQRGTGRYALKKGDEIQQIFDTKQGSSDFEEMIKSMGANNPAKTPDEQKVAEVAMQRALPTYKMLGAQAGKDEFDKAYQQGLSELKKRYPGSAGAGGGGGGPSKMDIKLEQGERDETDKIIRRVGRDDEVKAMNQGVRMAQRSLSSLDAHNGMGDLDAFKSYLLAMSGKVVTDKEMEQFMHSTGAWTGWEKKYNEYAAKGEFPEEFTRPLRAMMERFARLNAGELVKMGNAAKQEARLAGLGDAAQSIVFGHFTGDFGGAEARGNLREKGKRPAPEGDRKKKAFKELDDLGL